MALNTERITQYLRAESPWHGGVASRAPMWAQAAIQARGMVPRLDGKLATRNLSDWHLLALWVCWMGPRFKEREAGQQLVAQVESQWRDFKEWLWRTFGT